MADLRETLTMLRDLGVRTAHFDLSTGQLSSVTFGDGGQGGEDEKDEEDEGQHAKMARAAAAVLTGKAKTLEKAIEAQ